MVSILHCHRQIQGCLEAVHLIKIRGCFEAKTHLNHTINTKIEKKKFEIPKFESSHGGLEV